uniref:Uncharacterized protein n=1 Tax=Chenopodium quinoa TaxID=63459 RepID=A0A803N9K1_CHEQI
MADLKAPKQTSSEQEYHDSFDTLASRIELSEAYLLSCYLAGLQDNIQLAVRMFNPTTLQQALCLAKLQEAARHKCKGKKLQLYHMEVEDLEEDDKVAEEEVSDKAVLKDEESLQQIITELQQNAGRALWDKRNLSESEIIVLLEGYEGRDKVTCEAMHSVSAMQIEEQYPEFDPWGQGSLNGGSINVIDGAKAELEELSSKGADLEDAEMENSQEKEAEKEEKKERTAIKEEGMSTEIEENILESCNLSLAICPYILAVMLFCLFSSTLPMTRSSSDSANLGNIEMKNIEKTMKTLLQDQGHKFKRKKPQLYHIEVEELEEVDEVAEVEFITPLWVKVADGNQIKYDQIIKGFTWRMQGVEFSADVFLLPLSGSDLVHGINGLSHTLEYKSRNENMAADALSRVLGYQLNALSIYGPLISRSNEKSSVSLVVILVVNLSSDCVHLETRNLTGGFIQVFPSGCKFCGREGTITMLPKSGCYLTVDYSFGGDKEEQQKLSYDKEQQEKLSDDKEAGEGEDTFIYLFEFILLHDAEIEGKEMARKLQTEVLDVTISVNEYEAANVHKCQPAVGADSDPGEQIFREERDDNALDCCFYYWPAVVCAYILEELSSKGADLEDAEMENSQVKEAEKEEKKERTAVQEEGMSTKIEENIT